jgi:hypothetical protein
MRRPLVVTAILLGASVAHAQSGPVNQVAPPTPPPTKGVVREVIPPMTVPKPGPARTSPAHDQVVDRARAACTLLENDEKLFAACDNSTEKARRTGLTHVPQTSVEWVDFAKKLAAADSGQRGRRRPLVVLNNMTTRFSSYYYYYAAGRFTGRTAGARA